MSNSNSFSLARVYQLIRMELRVRYKQTLIFSLIVLLIYLFFSFLGNRFSVDYSVKIDGKSQLAPELWISVFFIFFAFGVFYYISMNRRLRKSTTVSYPSIPASTGEKYLSIILLGFIYYIFAWVVSQLTLIFTALGNPTIIDAFKEGIDIEPYFFKVGFPICNPFFFITSVHQVFIWSLCSYFFYFLITSKYTWGWNSTRWWEKLIVLGYVSLFFFPMKYHQHIEPAFMWAIHIIITISFMVGAYFRLRKLEQL